MRRVTVSRRNGRLILRIEEHDTQAGTGGAVLMGKKYDAYEKAREAEVQSKARFLLEPTDQNRRDAEQAERAANDTFNQMLDDPEN